MSHDTRFFAASKLLCNAVSGDTLLDGFLISREANECTEATLRDYRTRLTLFLTFISCQYPDLALADVQRVHVEHYLLHLKERGRASWTLRTHYRALCAFYNWLHQNELIARSPLVHVRPPRVPKTCKAFLTAEQYQQLLAVCPAERFSYCRTKAMLTLLWNTGIRFSELAGLKLEDLDFRGRRIKVYGKGRRERFVPFNAEARKAIWRYLAYRDDALPHVWITEERTPLTPSGLTIAIRRAHKRAGIQEKDCVHIFRRTWAVRLILMGVPLKLIQILGGWESVTTLETYVAAIDSELALASLASKEGEPELLNRLGGAMSQRGSHFY